MTDPPPVDLPDGGGTCPEPAMATADYATLGQVPEPPWEVLDLHTDHLGSVRLVTRQVNGEIVSEHDFLPFGEEIVPMLDANTHLYTGHERDRETGLDYMLARYYGGNLPRFMSPDPIESWDEYEPQTWNQYVYAKNNPLYYVDPDGEEAVAATIGTGVAAGAGAGAAAAAGAVVVVAGASVAAGRGIGHIPIGEGRTVDDAVSDLFTWLLFSKGGKQNIRDSGLEHLTLEQLKQLAKDKALDAAERLRYIKELKARKERNKQKRRDQDKKKPKKKDKDKDQGGEEPASYGIDPDGPYGPQPNPCQGMGPMCR